MAKCSWRTFSYGILKSQIIVEFPPDRNKNGSLRLEDDFGNTVVGPFVARGKADQKAAENPDSRTFIADRVLQPNPTRDPVLPYGDTPLGIYKVTKIYITGAGTEYSADAYGLYGLVALEPLSGLAKEAFRNGRDGFAIHGGSLSQTGGLRPTNGCIRICDSDMENLIIALEMIELPISCQCVEISSFSEKVVPELEKCFENNQSFRDSSLIRSYKDETLLVRSYSSRVKTIYFSGDGYDFSGSDVKSIAAEAAKNNFNNCSGSVREVAQKMGVSLDGAQANDQVKYMENNWREVSMENAKKLAESGKLVVAGLAEKTGNGHVTVIVEGNGVTREGKTWPNVAGGSMGTKEAKEKPGKAYSEGGNTIRDAWGKTKRGNVKFYTPE